MICMINHVTIVMDVTFVMTTKIVLSINDKLASLQESGNDVDSESLFECYCGMYIYCIYSN